MLTGDKLETAENIAYSCSLLQKDMEIYRISSFDDTYRVCTEKFVKIHKKKIKAGKKCAIIFEGTQLMYILAELELKNKFLQITKTCDAVICSRANPKQKAELVRMIKTDDD
jgi:phospholipid-transporting ATPase